MEGSIELEVSDDGKGIAAERRREALAEGHIGLASVEQRVAANGGELRLQSDPGAGTRVCVKLLDQEPGAGP